MTDCLFCKIVKGEIPSYKIYEDEKTYAFLDIAEDFYGHTLVVPKKHCRNLLDAEKDDLQAVMLAVQKIAKHYRASGFDGVNILISNEPAAEQCVFHLHVHIIPRKDGENQKLFSFEKKDFDLNEIWQKLKMQ